MVEKRINGRGGELMVREGKVNGKEREGTGEGRREGGNSNEPLSVGECLVGWGRVSYI